MSLVPLVAINASLLIGFKVELSPINRPRPQARRTCGCGDANEAHQLKLKAWKRLM